MHTIIRLSEATALALHAGDYMAANKGLCRAQKMAADLKVSYNHLSKVLQQLTKAGLVKTARGPKGGFELSPAGRKATIRDFFEVTDGPLRLNACLQKAKVCRRGGCVFERFITETNERFERLLDRKVTEFHP